MAAGLFASDHRVRQGVLNALDHGLTEVTLWGEQVPRGTRRRVGSVRHHLSAAARAFKAQALAALDDPDGVFVGECEAFRCGVMTRPSVAADLTPAS